MNLKLSEITEKLSLLYNKNNKFFIVIFLVILVSIVSAGVYITLFSNEKPQSILSGKIFIDGYPAPLGTNVSVVLPSKIVSDEDGTNETGFYEIEVSNYDGSSFKIQVIYEGIVYNGTDGTGNLINTTLADTSQQVLDVFVSTSDSTDDENDDSDSSGSQDDDSNNDNDDGDSSGDDSNDRDNNSDEDSNNDDSDSSGSQDDDSNNDNDGDSSGDDPNDSEDDESSNDENTTDDEPEIFSDYLSVTKTIWNEKNSVWNQNKTVEIRDTVRFNITIKYTGINLSELYITDDLPVGLEYNGNATVNGSGYEPTVNHSTNSIQWNLSTVSKKDNKTVSILYNATVIKRDQLKNTVSVNLTRDDSTFFPIQQANATVKVKGDLTVIKTVKNSKESEWSNTTSVSIGETVRFNITVSYNGTYSITDLNIIDNLPNGLIYQGNATLNGQRINLTTIDNNQTLIYNNSSSISTDIQYIEFDANITKNISLQNNVEVYANESIGTAFKNSALASVTGKDIEEFNCQKYVKNKNSSWKKSITAYVGDIVTYKVIINVPTNKSIYNILIHDSLPDGVKYIENTSMYIWKNVSYEKEPFYNETQNILFWNESTQLIDSMLIIQYNVSIQNNAVLNNSISFSSKINDTGEVYTGSDSASITALNPILPLNVDIISPNQNYVGEYCEIKAIASGGKSPYYYEWDLDNDSVFEQKNKRIIITKWDEVGNYPISVRVIDNESKNCTSTKTINVVVERLIVDSGGPYYAFIGESIEFNGYAAGGVGNYSWFWDFGDGSTSSEKNPAHQYVSTGIFQITLRVTDENNTTVQETTSAEISLPDTVGPMITFESPKNLLYINGKPLIPFFMPLVFGPVEINVSAEDNKSTVASMELFINTERVKIITGNQGNDTWDSLEFGRNVIQVKAFDSVGNENSKDLIVWKFF